MRLFLTPYLAGSFGLLLLITFTGCQQRAASKLQGRWEGRPDSAAARVQRNAEKYGDAVASQGPAQEAVAQDAAADGAEQQKITQVTDWEKYKVAIQINFVSSERVEMSLDGQQPQSGRWKVVTTSPAGCSIEIETAESSAASQEKMTVRRRFELLLDEREGECLGFLLTESGADRQQGALYFRRPNSAAKKSKEEL